MAAKPKIAHAEVCNDKACAIRDLIVKGDRVSFVSVEQSQRTGIHPLDDEKMPSDITIPKDYVLVQDPTGRYLNKCHFYILPWHNNVPDSAKLTRNVANLAQEYFGDGVKLQHGSVDIPEGRWHRVAEVAFIRYRRAGNFKGNYEHPYNPPVWLYDTDRPLGWRIVLPTGCVVDARGFVWP
jgi:hypothetical protein